jgi:hypothetical protein
MLLLKNIVGSKKAIPGDFQGLEMPENPFWGQSGQGGPISYDH